MSPLEPAGELHAEMRITEQHASFAGHFPGFPILPGAVLLDEALHEIERSRGLDLTRWRLTSVKFLAAVRPGDVLTLQHVTPDASTIRFDIRSDGRATASGTMTLMGEAADGVRGT